MRRGLQSSNFAVDAQHHGNVILPCNASKGPDALGPCSFPSSCIWSMRQPLVAPWPSKCSSPKEPRQQLQEGGMTRCMHARVQVNTASRDAVVSPGGGDSLAAFAGTYATHLLPAQDGEQTQPGAEIAITVDAAGARAWLCMHGLFCCVDVRTLCGLRPVRVLRLQSRCWAPAARLGHRPAVQCGCCRTASRWPASAQLATGSVRARDVAARCTLLQSRHAALQSRASARFEHAGSSVTSPA